MDTMQSVGGFDGASGAASARGVRQSKVDRAYLALKQAIVSGELAPQILIDKNEWSAHFEVSRLSITSAINRLAFERLVVIEPQRGSYVTRIRLTDVEQWMMMRRLLEMEVVANCAIDLPERAIEQLSQNLAYQRAALDSGDLAGFHELDTRYHRQMTNGLSRDSRFGQRNGHALLVEVVNGSVDGLVEVCGIGEGLMGEVMRLEIAPDGFDVVEFGSVFGQPLDREPVRPRREGRERQFADMDRPVVLDQHDGLCRPARLGTEELIELLEMGHEVGAALAWAGVDDELAGDVIERPQHRHLLSLSRRGHAQVGACLRPSAGEIGMRQRLAFIAVEQNDVAGFGLAFAQLQAQADPIHLAGGLSSLQRVPGAPPAEVFFRNALDNCERLMRTPSRASISALRRAIVQFVRSATGWSSNGVTTRSAVLLFTGGGPGAMLASNAATPPLPKSLRHSRTVSSRTPKASAIRALVQPERVRSTARARSASPRSRDRARAINAARCFSLAATGDLPPMPHPPESMLTANCNTPRWSTNRNLLRPDARG